MIRFDNGYTMQSCENKSWQYKIKLNEVKKDGINLVSSVIKNQLISDPGSEAYRMNGCSVNKIQLKNKAHEINSSLKVASDFHDRFFVAKKFLRNAVCDSNFFNLKIALEQASINLGKPLLSIRGISKNQEYDTCHKLMLYALFNSKNIWEFYENCFNIMAEKNIKDSDIFGSKKPYLWSIENSSFKESDVENGTLVNLSLGNAEEFYSILDVPLYRCFFEFIDYLNDTISCIEDAFHCSYSKSIKDFTHDWYRLVCANFCTEISNKVDSIVCLLPGGITYGNIFHTVEKPIIQSFGVNILLVSGFYGSNSLKNYHDFDEGSREYILEKKNRFSPGCLDFISDNPGYKKIPLPSPLKWFSFLLKMNNLKNSFYRFRVESGGVYVNYDHAQKKISLSTEWHKSLVIDVSFERELNERDSIWHLSEFLLRNIEYKDSQHGLCKKLIPCPFRTFSSFSEYDKLNIII